MPRKKKETLASMLGDVEALVEGRRWAEIRELATRFRPQEIAEFLLEIRKESRVITFRTLSRQQSFEVFSYLESDQQDDLIRELTDAESRQLLSALTPDDRTALLEELPANMTRRLIALLGGEDLAEARQLLGYPEESVGRLMTPDYVDVRPDWTIGQALGHIRQNGKDSETITMIYVTDESDKLIDDIMLRHLILAGPAEKVESLMDRSFVSLSAFDDREKAVQMIELYDLVALPVVDSDGELLGIVTVDDVIDVAEEEATEDIQKSASVSPLKVSYRSAGVLALYGKRIWWLGWLVLLSLASSGVIAAFEHKLSQTIVLLFFVPLLIGTGGNTGAQSATLMIRALVLGDLKLSQWFATLSKELAVGVLLGFSLGLMAGLIGLFRTGFRFDIACVVFLSMCSIVIMANIVGMALPFVLAKLRLDPAVASGPLISTITDATGLLIYFWIATMVIRL